jgi:subtilisin family serine protease
VAKKVTIVPVRIFDCDGGVSTEDINLSLDWIMSDHQAGTPAVVNMSLGGSRDDLMDAKIQDVIDSGITVVVAAGNEGQNSCDVSPARLPGAITVNASTLIDDDAIYSNWGECSDLYAPGTDVTSAWFNGNTATATISGTSMASPHVAGAVARILSASPTLTPAQVWAKLAVAATPFDPGLNDDIEANCEGFGLDPDCVGADPEKLLYAGLFPTDSTVPVPTGLVATPGAGTIGLTWSALDETNGPIIDYVIQYRWTNQSTYTTFDDGISVSRDVTITRLRPAYAHSVRVAAQTASGVGAFSADTLVSTLDVSVGAPTTVSATSGLTTVQLRWTAPTISSAAGTINDYLISYRVAGTTSWSIFADGTSVATTATVRSLSRGKSYDFSVKATIPYREGTAAVLRGSTLTGIATAPTALATSSTTTTSLALRWVAPSKTNGGVITDYIVRYRVAGTTTWLTFADGKRTATTATITRLVRNKSYNVEVKAVTLAGSTALNGATVTGRFATRR